MLEKRFPAANVSGLCGKRMHLVVEVNPQATDDIVVQVPDGVDLLMDPWVSDDGTLWVEGRPGGGDIHLDSRARIQAGAVHGSVSDKFTRQTVKILKPAWWEGRFFEL